MNDLIAKWNAKADECERKANAWDTRREYNAKWYTSMNESERQEFNLCRNSVYELRLQRNVYRECANQLKERLK